MLELASCVRKFIPFLPEAPREDFVEESVKQTLLESVLRFYAVVFGVERGYISSKWNMESFQKAKRAKCLICKTPMDFFHVNCRGRGPQGESVGELQRLPLKYDQFHNNIGLHFPRGSLQVGKCPHNHYIFRYYGTMDYSHGYYCYLLEDGRFAPLMYQVVKSF